MPFSGPSSYLPTIDEFVGHWTDVDAALSPALLTLNPDAYGLEQLEIDRGLLASAITTLEVEINDWEVLRGQRDNQKEPLQERMRQLNAYVKSQLRDSSYVEAVRPTIQINEYEGKWLVIMEDCVNMWSDINTAPPAGFTPPLLLHGGYALATFTTDTAALKATFASLGVAEQHVDKVLEDRDKIYRRIRDRLVQYREAVIAQFPQDDPLVLSLPRVSPLPGHTPEPVVLSGSWNAGTLKADLSWTASTDVDLDHYEVRRSGSDPYNSNTEVMVDSVPAGTTVLATDAGLTAPGTMRYKVYVVLNTSNEKGSNAVAVTRP